MVSDQLLKQVVSGWTHVLALEEKAIHLISFVCHVQDVILSFVASNQSRPSQALTVQRIPDCFLHYVTLQKTGRDSSAWENLVLAKSHV